MTRTFACARPRSDTRIGGAATDRAAMARTVMAAALLAAAHHLLPTPSAHADPGRCPGMPAPLLASLDTLRETCRHPLCGMATPRSAFDRPAPLAASPAPPAADCPHPGWPALLDAIAATLRADGLVLLGEIHDNNVHHTLRAGLVGHPSGLMAGVVFEQLDAEAQAALLPPAGADPTAAALTLDELLERIGWARSPWSKTADYRPLFAAVLAAGRNFYAGDPSRAAMRRAAKEGLGAVPPEDRGRLGLDTPLAADLDDASRTEIKEAHCGLMPDTAIPPMAFAQRFRDAHLADVLISAARGSGAVLIAGNGHVRADRGVPWYLARRVPGRPVLTVLLGEVEGDNTIVADYMPRDPSGSAVADWLVLTSKQTRPSDPCAQMRAAFEAIRKDPR